MTECHDLDTLPPLPDGWYYERHISNPDVVHVVWPKHGAESINFRLRITERGWCIPLRPPDSRFTGRGWPAKLIASDVSTLQKTWE